MQQHTNIKICNLGPTKNSKITYLGIADVTIITTLTNLGLRYYNIITRIKSQTYQTFFRLFFNFGCKVLTKENNCYL